MMYQIALCDDEKAEMDKTEQLLGEYEREHADMEFLIERFRCAEELLRMVAKKSYAPDLIFMDIYMPKKMGIEAAQELRGMGNESRLVFLTTSKEHALDAFRVDAAQYLVKPVTREVLFPMLEKFFGNLERERRKYVILRINGRMCRVAVSDIIYCEAQGKSQCVQFSDGSQQLLHMTMTDLYETLSQHEEFVRVGAAYIVNLEHVENISAQEIGMSDGKLIFLPRGAYRPLKERYFHFYCEES